METTKYFTGWQCLRILAFGLVLGFLCITFLMIFAPKFAGKYPAVYAIALLVSIGGCIVWYHRYFFQDDWLNRLGVRRLRASWQVMLLTLVFYGITELWEALFPSASSILLESSLLEILVVGLILGPIVEEMVFRQLLYGTLIQQSVKPILIAIITALLFSLMHYTGEIHFFLELFVAGLFYFYLRLAYDTILAPIASHMLHNGIVILVEKLGP